MLHRKTVRRGHEPGDCHELTFSCQRRLPLLSNDAWCRLFSEGLARALHAQAFHLVAFVLMPDHVHLLVYPSHSEPRLDLFLKAVKRPFAFRLKRLLLEVGSPLAAQLTVRERPGVHRFRAWQEGGGYDRNLHSEAAVRAAIDYIHLNPVRRGYCERALDWKWSSARWYHDPGAAHDPDLPPIAGLPPEFFTSTAP